MIGRKRYDCNSEDWACGLCTLSILGFVGIGLLCLGDDLAHPIVGNSTFSPHVPCAAVVPFHTCKEGENAYSILQDTSRHYALSVSTLRHIKHIPAGMLLNAHVSDDPGVATIRISSTLCKSENSRVEISRLYPKKGGGHLTLSPSAVFFCTDDTYTVWAAGSFAFFFVVLLAICFSCSV